MDLTQSYFIAGGAGFIGSHFIDHLLSHGSGQVTVYDNFSSGSDWHIGAHRSNSRLGVVQGNLHDHEHLTKAMAGAEVVIHLASNPDIARAATDPDIDFREGTELTRAVAEAVRLNKVPLVLYASGSGVYGDLGFQAVGEDHGPLVPISTYGASKLAGEALLCSYAYMFDFKAIAFRFANVVGARQTHGVAFDFIRRLQKTSDHLDILGDGTQSKAYIHATDIVAAVLLAAARCNETFQAFNVSTPDALSVTEIADMVCSELQLKDVKYRYSGGDRGWKGDIPIVRLATDRIQALGWASKLNSRQAMLQAIREMISEKARV